MTDLQYFEKLCEMDDGAPDVSYKIGLCYYEGKGVAKNYEEAMIYMNYSAGLGYEKASEFINSVSGKSSKFKDLSMLKQFDIYKSGFEKNNPEALMYLLEDALDNKHTEIAKKVLTAVKNNGDCFLGGKFEYLIGLCYERGIGTEKDAEKALECYLNSSDCDDYPLVYEKLYNMYYKGEIQHDVRKAVKFKEKYAKAGSANDKFEISQYYLKGQHGFIKDERMSIHWANLALLDLISETKVTPESDFDISNTAALIPILIKTYQINPGLSFNLIKRFCKKQDILASLELCAIYAENGYKEYQYVLGIAYLNKENDYHNDETGFYWIKKAADGGNKKALEQLAICYFYGKGTDVNYQEFFNIVSNEGFDSDEISMCLALNYYYGYYTEDKKRNLPSAIRILKDLSKGGYKKADEYLNDETLREFSVLEGAAGNGDEASQIELGNKYLEGIDVPKDIRTGLSFLTKAALKGSKKALVIVLDNYELLENDKYCNPFTAYEVYETAAKFGFANAEYMLARCYERGYGTIPSMEHAIEYYIKGAKKECPNCCYKLGELYEDGIWVPKNMKAAISYYKTAAQHNSLPAIKKLQDSVINELADQFEKSEAGDTEACAQLGQKYLFGHTVEKDPPKAVEYLTTAAKNGNANAAFYLASCYEKGEKGVAKNEMKAYEWFEKASDLGDNNAARKLNESKYIQIKTLKNIIAKGNPEGIFKLGYDYFQGTNIEIDYKQAFELFSLAAEKNYPLAMYYCGECYEKGLGTEVDLIKALEYYDNAASQKIKQAKKKMKNKDYAEIYSDYLKAKKNDNTALKELGFKYYHGIVLKKNIPLALQLITKAAERKDLEAINFLAAHYFNSGDTEKGKLYLSKAASLGDSDAKKRMEKLDT